MSEPKQRRTLKSGGRAYIWKDERYVSVTTILKDGIPKPALLNWAAETAAAAAYDELETFGNKERAAAITWAAGAPNRIRDTAALRGSAVHDFAEKMSLGVPLDIQALANDDQRAIARGFIKFFEEMKPAYLASECSVFSRRFKYAGTADAFVDFPDHGRLIIDFKTKPSAEKSRWTYPEQRLQLAAYRYADFIGMPDGSEEPVPGVEGAAIVYLYPDNYAFHLVEAGERELRIFRYCAQVGAFLSEK